MATEHKFGESIEKSIATIVVSQEYETAKSGREYSNNEYESMLDIIDCVRSEKEYEWMSDYFVPEYPAIRLTKDANYASQYFQTREYVEVHLQDSSDNAKAKADAEKELQNRT